MPSVSSLNLSRQDEQALGPLSPVCYLVVGSGIQDLSN